MKVTIISFAFKCGLPEDPAGNGGGFVFDCREIPSLCWDEALRDNMGDEKLVFDFLDCTPEMVELPLENLGVAKVSTDGETVGGASPADEGAPAEEGASA